MTGGRELVDLAVLADGGQWISDIGVLRDQGELFGPVAWPPDVWRALSELDLTGARWRLTARKPLSSDEPLHNGGG